jgi:aquaporin Z
MREYLTETIGTFFLVLTVGLTVMGGSPMAPLAIGASLMIMVYMGGHISGGHYNPAVTLAVAMRGKLPMKQVVPYWISQLVGATLAALAAYCIMNRTFAPALGPGVTTMEALAVEFLYTFALCIVVLHTATSSKTQGNSYYGLAIGFTIVVAAFAGGGVSGGAFNPAVGTGPTLIYTILGHGTMKELWIYWVGPLLGGAAAAIVFKMQGGDA